jgi:hypothetical protein
MKVSFDFDGTLSLESVQEYAKDLVSRGLDVHIVTSRHSDKAAKEVGWWWILDQNKNLFNVAQECGIDEKNITFTNGRDKIEYLKGKDFKFHLDDDEIELMLIFESDEKCMPLNVGHSDWRDNCETEIKS